MAEKADQQPVSPPGWRQLGQRRYSIEQRSMAALRKCSDWCISGLVIHQAINGGLSSIKQTIIPFNCSHT